MTEISKEIFQNFQVRKTRKQKTKFINFLKERIEGVRVEEGGLIRSRNIIIGDVEQADIILGAHYDTCARLFFPNFLTPKNLFVYILYNFLICVGFFGICSAVLVGSYILTRNIDLSGDLFTASMWVLLFLMLFGPANKHNANDNTSGVITLIEIIQSLTDEQKQKVAFVFFDHEEIGLLGSMFFSNKHKKAIKNKLFINFDCVASGDNIMVIQNKRAEKAIGDLIKQSFVATDCKNVIFDKATRVVYPSDQVNFSSSIAIAAFKKHRLLGLYLDEIHTKKDVHFDETNIKYIQDSIQRFIVSIS